MSHPPKFQSHNGPNPKRSQPQPKIKQTAAPAERLKTIVRRLPPNLPEEIFWQSVSLWVTNETVTWKIFYQGKLRKKLNRESVPSRAYIAFKTVEQVAVFSQQYDGHMFRDKQGNESFAIVEFAPYQKVPSEKKKADTRTGTILEADDYISFVESLNKAADAAETINPDTIEPTTLQPIDDTERSTPLLDALKAEKEASRDAANIIRHHPHYAAQSKAGASGSRAKDRANKEDDSTFSRSNEPSSPVAKAKDSKIASSSKEAVSGGGPSTSNTTKGGQMSKKQAQKAKNQATSDAQPNQNTTPRANKPTRNPPNTPASTSQQARPDRSTPRPVQDTAEPSGSAVVEDGLSTPAPQREPGAQRERKRPAGNQRMFEAAVAGAMGSTPAERRPRPERSEEGEKDKEQAVRGNREKAAGGNRGGRHPPQPRAILTRDSAAVPTPSSSLSIDAASSIQSDAPKSFVSGQPQPPQGQSEVRREAVSAEPNAESDRPTGAQGGNNGHTHPPNNPRGRRGRGFRGSPFGRGRGGAIIESNHERRVDTG